MCVTPSLTVLAGLFDNTTVWFTLPFTSRHGTYSIDSSLTFPLYWFAVVYYPICIIKYIALTYLYCHVMVNYTILSNETLTHFLLAKPCINVFSTVVLFIVVL